MNQNLVDIRDVSINTKLPVADKINNYIDQIINPYHFKCDGVDVSLDFNGKDSLEEIIIKHLSNK